MYSVVENAQNIKNLHPNADIDPFTQQPLSTDNNIESLIRAHYIKNGTDAVAAAASAEMSRAQQNARDLTGSDAGCTHSLANQVAIYPEPTASLSRSC